jgi:hypothetical protein
MMLAGLTDAIEGLMIPADGAAIAQAIALRDRLDARITAAVGEFDAAKLWDLDAATSMTAWLRASAKMTSRAAKRLTSVAARLHRLPVCAAAYADGLLAGGQVEAIVACLDDALAELFADYEAELVPYLAPLTPAGISRAMASWKDRVQPDGPEPEEPERSLHLSQTLDDRWVLDGTFDAEGGSVIAAALRLATTEATGTAGTPSGRRADAMVDICRFFLDNQRTRTGGRHRPHLNVVAELDAVEEGRGGRVVGGPAVDGPTLSRLLCDCSLHRVITAGRSAILDYGTATRTIPAPLWSALVIRDEHCRFPGCDRPSNWCEGHHVVWVTHHGATELANLVLLCSRHHHRLHQPGWHAKLRPDGGFEVTDPEGCVRATSPPRASPGW